ncbi:MAG TPA: alanine--tRNA ligase [Bdellovibrionales bacterium]|nr:alanine--tRNA ligase [Pseudobdellovibrionaceae bacterium]HAG90559.1 alanine--tRNA ligase [Bdellovibrionales bacterium]|tara:strand:+ start:853 stop:3534 length:2682 start_codon:yes stop_codon:yes gene_type:complete
MNSSELREKFLKYFQDHGHERVQSSSLVPQGDSTLLFTNAGMNQFKNVFLGAEKRPYTRAASSQKCVRAGGKHNDLENVGWTARHHTFFEMLGNFSFGDYFKKDAIHYAWKFILEELQLPKDRLYVTVFEEDDEAAEIWHKQEGIPKDRIYRFGEKDNFWRMGDTGPCGPCSEIFYDLGDQVGGDPKENVMGGEGDRFMEIWNLVFMQYNDDGQGNLTALPNPSIDTGMGLERLTTVMQNQISNYHTDVFMDLIHKIESVCGKSYQIKGGDTPENVAFRVLADHSRAISFLIADGVLPSNEGRGYVLRRILRRAIRFGRELSKSESLLLPASLEVIEKMSQAYPELKNQKSLIEMTLKDEEQRFLSTLDQGLKILEEELGRLPQGGTLSGAEAFKLYDTFGFPVDLTRLIAEEKGFHVDEQGFESKIKAAKEMARRSWKGKALSGDEAFLKTWTQDIKDQEGPTLFTGYSSTAETGTILSLSDLKSKQDTLKSDQEGFVILKSTPFYAEGGGQVGDHGSLHGSKGKAEILDCIKQNDIHLHRIKVTEGEIFVGDSVLVQVDGSDRRDTANNHSATHLLHWALRKVLGDHVSQAGSLVESDRLRFDFTHNKPLTPQELEQVESLVAGEIAAAHNVQAEVLPQKEALKKGAMALFGEKYGDEVRVITMGPQSIEFCGGTHVQNTSQILCFKIVSESGVSAGVRRMEALTGLRALEYLNLLAKQSQQARSALGQGASWEKILNDNNPSELREGVEKLQGEVKKLRGEIKDLKGSSVDVEELIKEAHDFKVESLEGKWLFVSTDLDDRKVLSELSDKLRDKLSPSIVILTGQGSDTHPILVSVSKELSQKIKAGDVLKDIASKWGGKGGGRPDFAQGAVASKGSSKEIQEILSARIR